MRIVVPVLDGITALDAIGPYEVLSRLPDVTVTFLGPRPGPVRTENGMLGLVADGALDEVRDPDVIVVPGGFETRALCQDELMLAWLRAAHAGSTWTTSVGIEYDPEPPFDSGSVAKAGPELVAFVRARRASLG